MNTVRTSRKPLTYATVGIAAAVAALSLVLATSQSTPDSTVSGTYDLDVGYAPGCVGAGDYVDVYAGSPVWVLDEAGHPLAHSALEYSYSDRAACHFTFTVTGASDPFWVQVGSQAKTRIADGLALRSGPPRQP